MDPCCRFFTFWQKMDFVILDFPILFGPLWLNFFSQICRVQSEAYLPSVFPHFDPLAASEVDVLCFVSRTFLLFLSVAKIPQC